MRKAEIIKNPNKPYYGKCQGCGVTDWLDVGHQCAYCFATMDMEAQSVHMAHIRWVNAGRPETDNPWESK